MSEPTDGWGEGLAGMLRLAAQLASQYAEHIARRNAEVTRLYTAARDTEAAQARARLTAERDAARALTAPTTVPGWWDAASREDVAHAWEVARAWAATDPRLAEAAAKIEAEIRARYGVDAHGLWAEVRAHHASTPTERAEAAAVLAADRAAGARDGQAAPTLTAVLDRHRPEPAPGQDVDLLAAWGMRYDSPEARAARADRFRAAAGADVEAADALITADQSQATPPAAAVAQTPTRQPKAKAPRRGRGAEHQAER